MVERDAAWFFKLVLLCPKLKLLLTFGRIIGKDARRPESLLGFLYSAAPKHGFKMVYEKPHPLAGVRVLDLSRFIAGP